MRTLALALAAFLPIWLTAPEAHAVCLSQIDCIRQRFGQPQMLRPNSFPDRTGQIGANAPAGRRAGIRAGRPAVTGRTPAAVRDGIPRSAASPGSTEVRPGIYYTPDAALDTPRTGMPDSPAYDTAGPTVRRYQPAQPSTGAGTVTRPSQPAAPADLLHSAGTDR